MTLMATLRFSFSSHAKQTSAIPPWPSRPSRRYRFPRRFIGCPKRHNSMHYTPQFVIRHQFIFRRSLCVKLEVDTDWIISYILWKWQDGLMFKDMIRLTYATTLSLSHTVLSPSPARLEMSL